MELTLKPGSINNYKFNGKKNLFFRHNIGTVQLNHKTVKEKRNLFKISVIKSEDEANNLKNIRSKEEFIEVNLSKPLGLRFARGRDGAAYVIKNDPGLGNTDSRIEVGDKVVQVSASFGEDVWDAKNFGQIMYAIRTRNGDVYLKFKRMYGDLTILQVENLSDAEKMWQKERAGGNVGLGTREIQRKNFLERKEKEKERIALFQTALNKFQNNEIEEALIDFENVIALEPKKFIGDNFSRVTDIYPIAYYNVACCYSSLNQIDAALESIETALSAGFEDFNKIRNDPNLQNLRKTEKLDSILKKYDESIINENAIKVLKNIFSFGQKK